MFFLNKNLKMNRGGEAILRVIGLHCGWGIHIHSSGTYRKTANPWTMDHSPSSPFWPSFSSPHPLNLQPWATLPPDLSFGPILLSSTDANLAKSSHYSFISNTLRVHLLRETEAVALCPSCPFPVHSLCSQNNLSAKLDMLILPV